MHKNALLACSTLLLARQPSIYTCDDEPLRLNLNYLAILEIKKIRKGQIEDLDLSSHWRSSFLGSNFRKVMAQTHTWLLELVTFDQQSLGLGFL